MAITRNRAAPRVQLRSKRSRGNLRSIPSRRVATGVAEQDDQTALALATTLVDRLGATVQPGALVEALKQTRHVPLSRQAREFIREHSGITQPVTGSTEPVGASVHSGLQAKEVAAMLGVDKSTVSRYVRGGKLYAIDLDGRQRFPLWQFVSDHPLPGLAVVVGAIPEGWGPIPFARFMTTPDEALGDLTPVEWLNAGGAPAGVAALLDEEARA